jgi:hypothetical protein
MYLRFLKLRIQQNFKRIKFKAKPVTQFWCDSGEEFWSLSFDFWFLLFSSIVRWHWDTNELFFTSGISSGGCESFNSFFPTEGLAGERLRWGGKRGGGKNGKWSWAWPPPIGEPKWAPGNMNGKWDKLSERKMKDSKISRIQLASYNYVKAKWIKMFSDKGVLQMSDEY